jgi:hypothetical protein
MQIKKVIEVPEVQIDPVPILSETGHIPLYWPAQAAEQTNQ